MSNQATIPELRRPMEHPVVESMSAGLLDVIRRAATDPNVDVDKMERLLAMQERVLAREAKAAFTTAMAVMQEELPEIAERGEGHNSIRYALWEDVNEAIKPVLAKHGFALNFKTRNEGGNVIVTGILSHVCGHSEQTELSLPSDSSGSKNAVQAIGSSTSYGKRYTAQALLNLSSRGEDDNGHKGGGKLITEKQANDLEALAEDVGADKKRFLSFLRVADFESIPERDYLKAVAALNDKRAK